MRIIYVKKPVVIKEMLDINEEVKGIYINYASGKGCDPYWRWSNTHMSMLPLTLWESEGDNTDHVPLSSSTFTRDRIRIETEIRSIREQVLTGNVVVLPYEDYHLVSVSLTKYSPILEKLVQKLMRGLHGL